VRKWKFDAMRKSLQEEFEEQQKELEKWESRRIKVTNIH
jgi:hypothetical protein